MAFLCGVLAWDEVFTVSSYPEEDAKVRAAHSAGMVGGNAANAAGVVAGLLLRGPEEARCEAVGTGVSCSRTERKASDGRTGSSSDGVFTDNWRWSGSAPAPRPPVLLAAAVGDLQRDGRTRRAILILEGMGVDTSLCASVSATQPAAAGNCCGKSMAAGAAADAAAPHATLPTSVVLLSASTGTRTIIHHRGIRELEYADISHAAGGASVPPAGASGAPSAATSATATGRGMAGAPAPAPAAAAAAAAAAAPAAAGGSTEGGVGPRGVDSPLASRLRRSGVRWAHFEGRAAAQTALMMEDVRRGRASWQVDWDGARGTGAGAPAMVVSVEIEKNRADGPGSPPVSSLLRLADVAFLSREYVSAVAGPGCAAAMMGAAAGGGGGGGGGGASQVTELEGHAAMRRRQAAFDELEACLARDVGRGRGGGGAGGGNGGGAGRGSGGGAGGGRGGRAGGGSGGDAAACVGVCIQRTHPPPRDEREEIRPPKVLPALCIVPLGSGGVVARMGAGRARGGAPRVLHVPAHHPTCSSPSSTARRGAGDDGGAERSGEDEAAEGLQGGKDSEGPVVDTRGAGDCFIGAMIAWALINPDAAGGLLRHLLQQQKPAVESGGEGGTIDGEAEAEAGAEAKAEAEAEAEAGILEWLRFAAAAAGESVGQVGLDMAEGPARAALDAWVARTPPSS